MATRQIQTLFWDNLQRQTPQSCLKIDFVFTWTIADFQLLDTVRRPLKEAFLASKIVILDYFSRELPF